MKKLLSLFLICIFFTYVYLRDENQIRDEIKKWVPPINITLYSKENRTVSDISLNDAANTFNIFDHWDNCTNQQKKKKEKNITINESDDHSYYLFLIETRVEAGETEEYKNKTNHTHYIEIRNYLGACLKNLTPNQLEIVYLTYKILWTNNLTRSIIVDYAEPLKNKENKHIFRAVFLGLFCLIYIFFCIYVWMVPKEAKEQTNKEMEKIQQNLENNMKDRYYDNYNDEDNKDSMEIINSQTKNNFDLTQELNYDSLYFEGKNKKERLKISEDLKLRKTIPREIYNFFNLNKNLGYLLKFKLSLTNPNNDEELHVISGIKSLCYMLVMFEMCLPIIFKVPIKNPKVLIDHIGTLIGQFFYNSDYINNLIFGLDGFMTAYIYIKNKKSLKFYYILFEILNRIFSVYFLLMVVYFISWQSFIFISDGPVSQYLFGEEYNSCNYQKINIMTMIVNFTFGKYENIYPFCVYHYWVIYSEIQYFIIGIFFVWCFTKFKSWFYVIYFLVFFNILILHITTLGVYPLSRTYYDVINKNERNDYRNAPFKFIRRIGPSLIGLLFGIFYTSNEIKRNFVKNFIQKYPIFVLILSLIIFCCIYLLQYFVLKFNIRLSDLLAFSYSLFRHSLITAVFLVAVSAFLTKNSKLSKFWKVFNNKITHVIEKIGFCCFVIMPIIARAFFYRINEKIEISNKLLAIYIVLLLFLTVVLSFILTSLFEIPFVRILKLLKSYYLNH